MSNHEPTSDQKFVLTFIVVIAVMALFSIGIFVLAQVLAAQEETMGSAERASISSNMAGDADVATKDRPAPVIVKKVVSTEKIVKYCGSCHTSGGSGSPRFDDKSAWVTRFKARGRDGLIKSVIEGRGRMSAYGGQDITDEQAGAAVDLIIKNTGAAE